jgi:hypothetical protein
MESISIESAKNVSFPYIVGEVGTEWQFLCTVVNSCVQSSILVYSRQFLNTVVVVYSRRVGHKKMDSIFVPDFFVPQQTSFFLFCF